MAKDITMTEDIYYEFNINHNSEYTITNEEADKEYVSDEKELLKLNEDKPEIKKEEKKLSLPCLIICSGVVLAVIIIVIIIIGKKKKGKHIKNNKNR